MLAVADADARRRHGSPAAAHLQYRAGFLTLTVAELRKLRAGGEIMVSGKSAEVPIL
jgi:hypothetical protein